MSHREFLMQRRAAEFPAFQRVLAALPQDKWDYKPHERSPSTRDLAWTIAAETKASCTVVDEGKLEWENVEPPGPGEILRLFEESYKGLDERIAKLDEAKWSRKVQMLMDGNVVLESPLGEFLWLIHFDAIHHRGQLSAYIRPMGGKVPSIYGPSGDDPGQ